MRDDNWEGLIKKLSLNEDRAYSFFYDVFWHIIRGTGIDVPKSKWDGKELHKWVGTTAMPYKTNRS